MSKKEISRLRGMSPADMSDDELDADFENVMDEITRSTVTGRLVELARRVGQLWPEITRRDTAR